MGGYGWTERESQYIADNYKTMLDAELAANLPGRTEKGVRQHRKKTLRLLKGECYLSVSGRRRRMPAHIRDGLFGGSDSSWGREIQE